MAADPSEPEDWSSPSYDEIRAAEESGDPEAIERIHRRQWWNSGMIGSWRAEEQRISEEMQRERALRDASGDLQEDNGQPRP